VEVKGAIGDSNLIDYAQLSMIKYKFAYDSRNQTIDIQTLSKESKRGEFRCLGCGRELVAVLGEKRVKHFRHKVIEVDCSPETYLHKLAKTRFYETYQNCLAKNQPFNIEVKTNKVCNFYQEDFCRSCKIGVSYRNFDLTKYFKKIFMECREGAFIPDVLLEAENQDKIFVEIAVTHRSSQEKVKSGYRIIELTIKSEEDIKVIESCCLSWHTETIKFINFKKRLQVGNHCQGQCVRGIRPHAKCELNYELFVIYKSGKSVIFKGRLGTIELLQYKILYSEYLVITEDTYKPDLYRAKVIEAYQKRLNIRNCFLCRYHALNTSWTQEGTIFCKFLKKVGNSNMAVDCQYFRADSEVFSQYLDDSQEENNQ